MWVEKRAGRTVDWMVVAKAALKDVQMVEWRAEWKVVAMAAA